MAEVFRKDESINEFAKLDGIDVVDSEIGEQYESVDGAEEKTGGAEKNCGP